MLKEKAGGIACNLRIFAHQKDKIIRIQNEEYTKFLHHCPH